MSFTKELVEQLASFAIEAPKKIAKNIPQVAAGAAIALGVHVIDKFDADKRIKKEKIKSFEHGVKEGNNRASKKIQNQFLCKIALINYVAQADNNISKEEKKQISKVIDNFREQFKLTKKVENEISRLTSIDLGFDDVKAYLDEIELDQIEKYSYLIKDMANSSKNLTYKEKIVIDELENYYIQRKNENQDRVLEVLDSDGDISILSNDDIKDSVNKYSIKYSLLESRFEKETKLNKKEVSLVFAATALQLIRIYLVNAMSLKEKANKGKKEQMLKKGQKRVLSIFKNENDEKLKRYYAPLDMIISSKGVPYDIQRYEDGKKLGLFKGETKGVNHRFATLGHDPLAGLLFGTINIMTNTLTSTKNRIPTTYHVDYSGKHPYIVARKASFVTAFNRALARTEKDTKPFIAAFVKQLIHIATDTYTPAGIQLPGSSLVLNENLVEDLTKSISYGDLQKAKTSLSLDLLINIMIGLLHKCMLIEDNQDYCSDLNIIKTNKIVDLSNVIASSSNVISTSIVGKIEQFDLAGYSVMILRLFNNIDFLYDVKYEFINRNLDDIIENNTR